MKKYFIISLGLFFVVADSFAQKAWSLRECINYAVENNIDLKQQALGVKQSELDLNTSKMSMLPNLNANASNNFDFGRSVSVVSNTSVGTRNSTSINTSFGLASTTPLFTGLRITNTIKSNELNLKAAVEGLKKAKENLELQVTTYFLEVLFKKELLKIAEEQVEQTKEQVSKTEILVDGGKVPRAQLYDIKAQLAKEELEVTNANNRLVLSLLDLSQALNITDDKPFDIQEPKKISIEENLSSIIPANQIYEEAIRIKPHVKEAEFKLAREQKNLNVAKAGYYPTLDLNIGYGTRYGRVSGFSSETISRRFKRQLRDNGSEYIGFTLNIPLFNRFQTRNRVRGAKLQIDNSQLELDNVKLAFFKEIQQAYQSAVAAQSKYTSTEKAYLAAKESYEYAKEKYAVGKSTVFEYNESKLKLMTSQSEQVQSKYDFLFRAKILDFYRGMDINIE